MIEYRRLLNSQTWHWMVTCHHWTRTVGRDGQKKSSVQSLNRISAPLSGSLCSECEAKAEAVHV